MDDTKECAICGEPIEDEDFEELPDGRIVCSYCYENELCECDECGECFPEDDMENWGDDMHLCPDCFRKYFPDFNKAENLKETKDAYEEMKTRFVGRKLEEWEDLYIKTDMDDECFSYSLEIDVDDNNIVTDISLLKIERCQWISITRECWLPYPVSIDDYKEGGLVDTQSRNASTHREWMRVIILFGKASMFEHSGVTLANFREKRESIEKSFVQWIEAKYAGLHGVSDLRRPVLLSKVNDFIRKGNNIFRFFNQAIAFVL